MQLYTSSIRAGFEFAGHDRFLFGGTEFSIKEFGDDLVDRVQKIAQETPENPVASVARTIVFGEMRSVKVCGQQADQLVAGNWSVPPDSEGHNYSCPQIAVAGCQLSVRDFCVLLSYFFTGVPLLSLHDPRYNQRKALQVILGN